MTQVSIKIDKDSGFKSYFRNHEGKIPYAAFWLDNSSTNLMIFELDTLEKVLGEMQDVYNQWKNHRNAETCGDDLSAEHAEPSSAPQNDEGESKPHFTNVGKMYRSLLDGFRD